MSSPAVGANTSTLEVTHIDSRGFWLYVDGKEFYLPFDCFPWFAEATVRQISTVERCRIDHFHWPELDVDLTLDRIENPSKYPLKSK